MFSVKIINYSNQVFVIMFEILTLLEFITTVVHSEVFGTVILILSMGKYPKSMICISSTFCMVLRFDNKKMLVNIETSGK